MGELRPGDLIDGKYRIIELIGEGGMGAVYRGENVKIQRRVAIKTLHAAVASSQEVVGRFEREATAAGRIGNAHILEVLDLGQMNDGDHYMVMELLEGEPLSSRIARLRRMTPEQLVPIMLQVLKGLGAAHDAGIVHRDLKPDNIFLLRDHVGIQDFVKIIDFGISKFQPLSGDAEGMSMTRTGAVMGTPYYMSPEQASGARETDPRTDLYAIGVIMYEAVSGHVPFDAPTFNQLIFKIALSEAPPITSIAPDIDPAFASIVQKAMARDVNTRFQTAEEFRQALEAWQSSGAKVSVPPAPDRASLEAEILSAAGATAPEARSAEPAASPATAGNWSASHRDLPSPATSNRSIVIGMAGAAILVLGLGSAGAYWAFSSPMSGAPDAEASAEPVDPSFAAPPEPEPEPVVVAPAPEPPSPPPKASASAEAEKEQPPEPKKPAVSQPPRQAVRSTPVRRVQPRRPPPRPTKKVEAPKPEKKQSDDLLNDFGY